MFGSIKKIIYRIHTTFGDLELVYGGEEIDQLEVYPQGVLQENTSGLIYGRY